MKIIERKTCRISGGEIEEVFSLGEQPLSSFPLPSDELPKKYPLVLSLNKDSGLVQLKHTLDPDEMYSKYWYLSGINNSMKVALKDIVDNATNRVFLKDGDVVIDIASNDGTLLSNYSKNVIKVGIDPAKNITPINCDYHINTYFSATAYKEIMKETKAKIITSICVLYDLEDPVKFAQNIEEILHEDGIWIAEMSYLPMMLERNSFETIVSEHIEYYSLEAIEYILSKTCLKIEDVELNEVNGGSFRIYVRHAGKEKESNALHILRKNEKQLKLKEVDTYKQFAERIEKNKIEMIDFLEKQKELGKLVIGYGASTKGNTMMSYYGIDKDLVPFVADRNSMKFGRETITRIPIISEQEARDMNPDYFLVFAYHFMPEFIEREKDFIDRGGKFISPIPTLTILPETK